MAGSGAGNKDGWSRGTIFNDSVHGSIALPPLCVKIIDTPQFQRLRNIKQLGGAYYVYPGASHNRFEHSIGVCHLAGELVKKLRADQLEQNIEEGDPQRITDADVLCVQIAGLCHDLGHGPMSHLFDKHVIPELIAPRKWKHEDATINMFGYMLNKESGNSELLKAFNEAFPGRNIDDIKKTIEDLIKPPEKESEEYKKCEKPFLREIVANEENKIDVDKWDYFARDCHHLGMKNNFDHRRLIQFARVIDNKICYRDKEELSLYEMFHTREVLHRRAYQHKITLIYEHMIAEALRHASSDLKFTGKDDEQVSLLKCIDDPVAYTKLDDTVLYLILNPRTEGEKTSDELQNAREILQRIERRQHYRFIWHITDDQSAGDTTKTFDPEKWKEVHSGKLVPQGSAWSLEDIVIKRATFDYGCKTNDPIESVSFYSKDDIFTILPKKKRDSMMKPRRFQEVVWYSYMKKDIERDDLKKVKKIIEDINEMSDNSAETSSGKRKRPSEKCVENIVVDDNK